MPKNHDGQLEVVLENRQLLIIFFVVVALCGVFFSLGYIVGHNTFSSAAPAAPTAMSGGVAGKPSPMPPAAYAGPVERTPPAVAPEGTADSELNFYQSAEENPPEAKLLPSDPADTPGPAAAPQPSPERPAPQDPMGILVQVSALTRREDANALVALLREKNLPVVVTSSQSDSLYHVVVGPYRNEKDAQGAKKALEEDGFRPIIKR